MRGGPLPGAVLSAVCLVLLAGCETTSDHTGSVAGMRDNTPSSTGLMGEDPKGDLELGKSHYRDNSFGLAEQHFRRAVEKGPQDLEAWVGLAASYDKLKRFDLADRAYAQAIRIAGPTAEILNNQGYSYLLRGDRQRARKTLLEAQGKDPSNPYIQNNLNLLDQSLREGAAVR
jgi:Flp pilus assembly protein TadD